jgi:hypothetical protein
MRANEINSTNVRGVTVEIYAAVVVGALVGVVVIAA